jgi:hypothetical protein
MAKMDPKLKAIQQINKALAPLAAEDRGTVLGFVQQNNNVDLFRKEREARQFVGGLGPGISSAAQASY